MNDLHFFITFPIIIGFYFVLGWELVQAKSECGGAEIDKSLVSSLDRCASICTGVSAMFIFGTNDYSEYRCFINGCHCYCETGASNDGTCNIVKNNGYRLYKYG